MNEQSETRVRINLKQSSKGDVQFDITSEFPNEDDAVQHLRAAIVKTRAMCKEESLKLSDSAA